MERNETPNRQVIEHHMSCCADPLGFGPQWAPVFWGVVLLAIGGAWIVANAAGSDSWLEWAAPAIIIVAGLLTLGRLLMERER